MKRLCKKGKVDKQKVADYIYSLIENERIDDIDVISCMKTVYEGMHIDKEDLNDDYYKNQLMVTTFKQDQAVFDYAFDKFFCTENNFNSWDADPGNQNSETYLTVSYVLEHMNEYGHNLGDLLKYNVIKQIIK